MFWRPDIVSTGSMVLCSNSGVDVILRTIQPIQRVVPGGGGKAAGAWR